MNNFFKSLPFRLLLGIAVGVICGLVFPENVMKVIVTLQYVMGQLITFCVPLIIIGFIAPSITKLGSSASRMLTVALILAYVSSILAAFMSMDPEHPERSGRYRAAVHCSGAEQRSD